MEPDYSLILTGVSMGGACVALLGLLLKEDYPGLRCYAYGTPGALLDINGALYTQSFVTTIAVGRDLIGRLSVNTARLLKQDLLTLASVYDDKPKYQILLEGMVETFSRCIGKDYSFPLESLGLAQRSGGINLASNGTEHNHNMTDMPHPPPVSPSSYFLSTSPTPDSHVSTRLYPSVCATSTLDCNLSDSFHPFPSDSILSHFPSLCVTPRDPKRVTNWWN
jgi:hypothetical protein